MDSPQDSKIQSEANKSQISDSKNNNSSYRDSKVDIHQVLSDKTQIGSDNDQVSVIGNRRFISNRLVDRYKILGNILSMDLLVVNNIRYGFVAWRGLEDGIFILNIIAHFNSDFESQTLVGVDQILEDSLI